MHLRSPLNSQAAAKMISAVPREGIPEVGSWLEWNTVTTKTNSFVHGENCVMARIFTIGSRAARGAAVLVTAAAVALGATGPAHAAASNRLTNGSKLKPGHCITDGPSYRKAKFCVGKYYNIYMTYKSLTCTVFAAQGHLSGPSAYVQVARNGDVRFYQYSGGRMLWHSKTSQFTGADLVIGSSRPGDQAKLGVDQPGHAFFIIKDCPFHD
jgi:hypothetical protein